MCFGCVFVGESGGGQRVRDNLGFGLGGPSRLLRGDALDPFSWGMRRDFLEGVDSGEARVSRERSRVDDDGPGEVRRTTGRLDRTDSDGFWRDNYGDLFGSTRLDEADAGVGLVFTSILDDILHRPS